MRPLVCTALTLAGLGAGGPAQAAPTTEMWTCERPAVKPARMNIWCYHPSVWTVGMRWTGWSGRKATATGTYVVNSCAIDCAKGPFVEYPARFTVSRPRSFSEFEGDQTALRRDAVLFTRMRVSFPGAEPSTWSGQPYLLVWERNPGTRACELVWQQKGSRSRPC